MSTRNAVAINLLTTAGLWLLLSFVEGQSGFGATGCLLACFSSLWCAWQVMKAKFDDSSRA